MLPNKEDKDIVIEECTNQFMEERNERINRLIFSLNG